MPTLRRWESSLIVALLFFTGATFGFVLPSSGQTVTATLYGRVADQDGTPLPGATVTLSSPQLLGQQTRITGREGNWRAVGLPRGTYTVAVNLSGFTSVEQDGIVVEAGEEISVNVTLRLSGVQETVTVTGETPIVDVRTTQLTSTIPKEIVENVPLGRSFHDLVTWTLPTVTDGGRYTYDLVLAAGGSGYQEEERALDGQPAAGTEFSMESLQATQATVAGLDAEYGTRSAGVFNFITKSGGNNFSGSLYGYLADEAASADNLTDELRAQGLEQSNVIVRDSQYGGNLGGPIVRDKLWFFTDINKLYIAEQYAGFPLSDVTNDRLLGFGKVTWQPAPAHRLTGSLNYLDRNMLPSNPGSAYNFDRKAWRRQFWNQKLPGVSWQWTIGSSGFLDVKAGGLLRTEDNDFPFGKLDNGQYDPATINGFPDRGTGINYGTWDRTRGGFEGRNHWDVRANFSYYLDDTSTGDHNFKVGLEQNKKYTQRWGVIANNLRLWVNSPTDCIPSNYGGALPPPCVVPDRADLYYGPADASTDGRNWSVYAQDEWAISDALTINAGLRVNHFTGWTSEQCQGPGMADAAREAFFSPDVGGDNVDFPFTDWSDILGLPTMQCWPERPDVVNITDVAPRFGVSWDPTEEGRLVIKGSVARMFQTPHTVSTGIVPNPNSHRFSRFRWLDCRDAMGNPISCLGLPPDQVNGDLMFTPNEVGDLLSTNLRNIETTDLSAFGVNPDLENWHVDAYTFGVETALTPDVSIGVTGILRYSRDFSASVDLNRWEITDSEATPLPGFFDQVPVTNPVTGEQMIIYLEKPEAAGISSNDVQINHPDIFRDYRALQLTFRKRYQDGWMLNASYVLSRSYGNHGTQASDRGFSGASDPNSFINSVGPLSLDSTHQIKVQASYLLPYDINFGVAYLGMTGYPAAQLAGVIGAQGAGSSSFRFVRGVDYPEFDANGNRYPQSSVTLNVEPRGTHRVDFRNLLNVRAEKRVEIGFGRLDLMLDVFNLFNISGVTHVQTNRVELSNFLAPQAVLNPLRARFGVRFGF